MCVAPFTVKTSIFQLHIQQHNLFNMGWIKFYRIIIYCILMVHAESSANNNGYAKYTESTTNPRYEGGDSYQTRTNIYNTENKGKDYSFPNKDTQLNNEGSNLPSSEYSLNGQSARTSDYIRTAQEPFDSNSYYINDHTYSNFARYPDKSNTGEPDFKKYKQLNLTPYSNDNYHDSVSYDDYTSGIHSKNIFGSSIVDEYGSDSDIATEGRFTGEEYIGDTYSFEKQNNDNILNYKGFNHENNVLNPSSFDMHYTKDNYKTIRGNYNQDRPFEHFQKAALTNYISNIRGKSFRFQDQEKRNNRYYPSKNDLSYLLKSYKMNHVPVKIGKGNTKTIIIRENRSNIYPRQVHSKRLYLSAIPPNINGNYKKRSNILVNRPIYLRGDSSSTRFNNGFVNSNYENNSDYISNGNTDSFTTNF